MSKTITKRGAWTVVTEINDELLALMKRFPDLAELAMQTASQYWHDKILPDHFKQDAHAKYGYASRSKAYFKSKHGIPDMISPGTSGHSGEMKRQLATNYLMKRVGSTIQLKMTARALNFVGTAGDNSFDAYVTMRKRRGGTKTYPNMKKEIKSIIDDEREALAKVVVSELVKVFQGVTAFKGA